MAIKVIAAPGPVCFPLIASESDKFNISFAKDGDAPIILDSSVGLMKRGIPIDLVLLSGLSVVTPEFGKKMALWRKGSANDYIARAIIRREKLPTQLVYVDNQQDIQNLMAKGEVDSAIVPVSSGQKGTLLEDRASKAGLYIPGSCSAKVPDEYLNEFLEAYNEGLKRFREKPEETAKYVNSVLPNKFPDEFVHGIILKMKPVLEKPGDYEEIRTEILNERL
ncbi:DUF3834 domain-containing protein [Cuniculiplasma sp. SKW3]|uniref:DUF3834 domain-containing protein n=1 Tax=Cuniculiplasma sp. SKW3 TaxID=3400170 RepID=UPI003FD0206F